MRLSGLPGLKGLFLPLSRPTHLLCLVKSVFRRDDVVVVIISGRGDKDMAAYIWYMENYGSEIPDTGNKNTKADE